MREIKTGKPLSERESASLDMYLQEISSGSGLSADEEKALARKIQSGDADALNRLVEKNLRFVVSIAKQYQDRGLAMTDLISEGNIGLMQAASKYDPGKNDQRFVKFAVWYVRRSIEAALHEQAGIYAIPKKSHSEGETIRSRAISVDAPLQPGRPASLLHVLANPNAADPDKLVTDDEQRELLLQAVGTLPEREQAVLRAVLGNDGVRHSYAEVGAELNLKRERVRQIYQRAVRRLRKTVK